jgi:hypothetical protein
MEESTFTACIDAAKTINYAYESAIKYGCSGICRNGSVVITKASIDHQIADGNLLCLFRQRKIGKRDTIAIQYYKD